MMLVEVLLLLLGGVNRSLACWLTRVPKGLGFRVSALMW